MRGPKSIKSLKQALLVHYTAPPVTLIPRFRNGALCFTAGLGMIMAANSNMEPSIQQELVVLCGLLLGAVGFYLALTAEIRFIIGRLIHLLR